MNHTYAFATRSPLYVAIALSLLTHNVYATSTQPQDDIEIIEVSGKRNQANSEITVETEKLLKVAGIMNDPLSAVYSMPGIVYAGGDNGGEPAVRGSSPDDNAFYIDNMPVTYIFHLFGDSIFNENLIRDFTLHPAAFGSEYGNATGGIFDVKLRDPRNQDLKTTIDLSMIKAGFMVEGGVTDNQAFYFSYRRSLIQLFLEEGEEEDGITINQVPASDDYQGKYQWLIGDNQKLTFSIEGASDNGGLNISAASEEGRVDPDVIGDLKLDKRFDNQGVTWHYFGQQDQVSLLTINHTSETSKESYGNGQFIEIESEKYNARYSYQFDLFKDHTMVAGLDWENETTDYSFDAIIYYCTDHDRDCESKKGERQQDKDRLKANNYAAYLTEKWKVNDDWQLDLGLRAEYNDYTKQNFVHPRISLTWFPTDKMTISGKVGSYSRFPNIDTALKKIGNPNIKSPKATHYALHTTYQLNDLWETSVDIYYKDIKHMARSLNEEDPNFELHYSNDLSGTAKGVEWLIKREKQNGWYGWASISWSKSDRTDEYTQQTSEYYLDTPLLANLVANYEYNERWDFGVKLSVRSGQKYTPIIALRNNPDHEGHYLPVYGALNSKTLPVYHRLDIQANYKTELWGREAKWSFALLNALGSDNISGYYYAPDGQETLTDYKIDEEKGFEPFASIGLKMSF